MSKLVWQQVTLPHAAASYWENPIVSGWRVSMLVGRVQKVPASCPLKVSFSIARSEQLSNTWILDLHQSNPKWHYSQFLHRSQL